MCDRFGRRGLDAGALALCGVRFGFLAGLGFSEFATTSVRETGVFIVFLLLQWLPPFDPVITLVERRCKRILRRELALAMK